MSNQSPLYIMTLKNTFFENPNWLFLPQQTCIWSENKSVPLKLPRVTNLCEDLMRALSPLPRIKCLDMQGAM